MTDFRAVHSTTKTKSVASGNADTEESGSSGKESVLRKRRKGKESVNKPKGARAKRRVGGGEAHGGRSRKRRDMTSPELEKEPEETDVALGSAAHAPPALAAKLRPRPQLNSRSTAGEVGEEDSDSDEEFVVKRRKL